jgi:hypothetical protein
MKFKNRTLRAGLAMSLATLFTASLITSCQKDAQVTTPTNEATTASNSMTVANTTTSLATTGYTTSSAISYSGRSNITISGLSISGGTNCITLTNCTGIHITNCRLANASNYAILLNNCKNITIDYTFMTNVKSGVHVNYGSAIKVNNNQFLNMLGPFPNGNFVQFVGVSGGGNQINSNHCEDIAWVGHPQDGLSVYKSNGLPGDSIQVIGNWIRGGQVQNDSGGGAGIVLGDVGGSYQVARNNTIVNGGFVGAQVQGGFGIKMDHNTIYSSSTPYSNCGLCYGNYSGAASYNVNMSYNKIRFYKSNGAEQDEWVDTKTASTPAGWSTNIQKASISATILPTTIITMK